MFGVVVNDIGPMDDENCKRVAHDLRKAADRIENDKTPDPKAGGDGA